MKKTVLVSLILVMFLLETNSLLPYVESQTQTSGIINSNTIWDKPNSPYTLAGPVTISSGATLTIEAGVQVNLNGNQLQANGTLVAQGSSTEKVYLSDGELSLNSDSMIENAVVSSDLQITVNSGAPSISHSQIDSRIIVKGGSPKISNNIISDGIHADAIGGPVTIENNNITSVNGHRAIYVQGIHADISGNIIVGNNNKGIQVYLYVSSVSIINNTIANCSWGIHHDAGSKNDVITQNAVFNNTIGIHNRGSMTLRENTIAYNEIGLASTHLATIENNNFMNNSRYNLENIHIVDFYASNNWWGTTNDSLIRSMIYDKNDESVRGSVYFMPFLTEPSSKAPTIRTEILTTPIPEFPSWIILPLVLAITLFLVVIKRNISKHKNLNV